MTLYRSLGSTLLECAPPLLLIGVCCFASTPRRKVRIRPIADIEGLHQLLHLQPRLRLFAAMH